jgi:hypothetical protein
MDFEEFTKLMNDDEEDKSVNKDELDEIVKYINDNLERCSLEEEQREKKLYETMYDIDMELKKTYLTFESAKIIDENQIELILGEQDNINIIPDYSNTIIIKILESEHYYFYAIVPYNENGALSNSNSIIGNLGIDNLISKRDIIDLILAGELLIGIRSIYYDLILINNIRISTEYGEIIEYYKNYKNNEANKNNKENKKNEKWRWIQYDFLAETKD